MTKKLFLLLFAALFFLSSCDAALAVLNETANALSTDIARTQAAEEWLTTPEATRSSATQPASTRAAVNPTSAATTRAAATSEERLATPTAATRSSVTQPANTRAAVNPTSAATTRVTATPNDGLKTIALNQLPSEARKTISLIDKGGPFPYDRDGIVFQNREGLLPKKASNYYHEYTVDTPGSSDRGARRIITGDNGELYYTDDHYESFKRVIR